MSLPSAYELEKVKEVCKLLEASPELIHEPQLDFFRHFIHSFTVPPPPPAIEELSDAEEDDPADDAAAGPGPALPDPEVCSGREAISLERSVEAQLQTLAAAQTPISLLSSGRRRRRCCCCRSVRFCLCCSMLFSAFSGSVGCLTPLAGALLTGTSD